MKASLSILAALIAGTASASPFALEEDQKRTSIGADFRYNQLSGRAFDFDMMWEGTAADYDYFIVLSPNELEAQPELAEKLNQSPIFYQGGGVTIYNLTAP